MNDSVIYVGMDVHKDSIVIAVARESRAPAKKIGRNCQRLAETTQRIEKSKENGGELHVCYEAGPTGFGLCRRLREAGIDCIVVAPSLVPCKVGDRVKTDRRDAEKLAHFLRSGDLKRFATPQKFMSFVGLVPSEDSTGKRRRQGSITRCGNTHLRRILVESAWHYRHKPALSKELRRRNQGGIMARSKGGLAEERFLL